MIKLPETHLWYPQNIKETNTLKDLLGIVDFCLIFKRNRTFEHLHTDTGKSIIYDTYIENHKIWSISIIEHNWAYHINWIYVNEKYQRNGIAYRMIVDINTFLYNHTESLLYSDSLVTVHEAKLAREKLVSNGLAERTDTVSWVWDPIYKMKYPVVPRWLKNLYAWDWQAKKIANKLIEWTASAIFSWNKMVVNFEHVPIEDINILNQKGMTIMNLSEETVTIIINAYNNAFWKSITYEEFIKTYKSLIIPLLTNSQNDKQIGEVSYFVGQGCWKTTTSSDLYTFWLHTCSALAIVGENNKWLAHTDASISPESLVDFINNFQYDAKIHLFLWSPMSAIILILWCFEKIKSSKQVSFSELGDHNDIAIIWNTIRPWKNSSDLNYFDDYTFDDIVNENLHLKTINIEAMAWKNLIFNRVF